jgi:hypothetical protein
MRSGSNTISFSFLRVKEAYDRLGDHSPEGYEQRSRFYRISDQARLLFAQNVAGYILFLAETTGIRSSAAVEAAKKKLASFKSYEALLDDIG